MGHMSRIVQTKGFLMRAHCRQAYRRMVDPMQVDDVRLLVPLVSGDAETREPGTQRLRPRAVQEGWHRFEPNSQFPAQLSQRALGQCLHCGILTISLTQKQV